MGIRMPTSAASWPPAGQSPNRQGQPSTIVARDCLLWVAVNVSWSEPTADRPSSAIDEAVCAHNPRGPPG